MVFKVAFYVPLCGRLEVSPWIGLQLCADNLKCSSCCSQALFDAAWFTVRSFNAVGQDVSLGQRVLLSSSKADGKAMEAWDMCGDGWLWPSELDVRVFEDTRILPGGHGRALCLVGSV